MELHKTSTAVLLAALTREDLSAFRLSFADLSADNAQTVRIVREILLRARRTLDFAPPARGTLRIDVLPEKNGGCIFLFTAHKTRLRVLRKPRTLFFSTQDVNVFLDIYKRLSAPPLAKAEIRLFRTRQGFAALFTFPDLSDAARAERLLSEYGQTHDVSSDTALHLAEHATELRLTPAPRLPAS